MYLPTISTHYSLYLGLSKPKQVAERLVELDLPGCILADNNLSGCIAITKAMKEVGKKALLGYRVKVYEDVKDRAAEALYEIVLIARSLKGWKQLLQIVAQSNSPHAWHIHPRLDRDMLTHDEEVSDLLCYNTTPLTRDDGEFLFGCFEDRFYSGAGEHYEFQDGQHKTKRIALIESYYPRQEDVLDHRILICAKLKTSFDYVPQKLVGEDSWLGQFFDDDRYYIKSAEQAKENFTDEELANTLELMNRCEDFSILSPPVLPAFSCPNDANPDEYLRQLCRNGWREKIKDVVPQEELPKYVERIKYELEVLQGAGLSSYFLIVKDILDFCHHNGWLTGVRGSAFGCLVSYLIGITDLDPVEYDLIFERFYNAARTGSYPDIDMDIPTFAREPVLQYLRQKYGEENVGQIITFQTLMGRGAIKAVFNAYGKISATELNAITENIIDKSKIADELQQMKDDGHEPSVIRWALENKPEAFKDYCYLDENDKLQGPMAKRFEQAMRLEGTKVISSRHPGGIVISPTRLSDYVPMALDLQHMAMQCALEMDDAASAGLVKLDVLGLNFQNKVMGAVDILLTGDIKAYV